jgi:hypothetical protein
VLFCIPWCGGDEGGREAVHGAAGMVTGICCTSGRAGVAFKSSDVSNRHMWPALPSTM